MIFPPGILWDCFGPPTFKGTWKWNCRIAHKRGNCSPFVGTELVLGVSRQIIQKQIMLDAQPARGNVAGLISSRRQAQKLILDPSLTAKTRLLFFNRTQTRVVTGLLTWHNTLRKYLYIMGLIIIPLCTGCGAEEEYSAHVLCECEALASLRHNHLVSFPWPWNFNKGIGLPWLGHQITGHKVPFQKVYVYWDQRGSNPFTIPFYSILHVLIHVSLIARDINSLGGF